MEIKVYGHPGGPVTWRVCDESGPVVGGIVVTWREAVDRAYDALVAEVTREALTDTSP
jgi:hypothetical protein